MQGLRASRWRLNIAFCSQKHTAYQCWFASWKCKLYILRNDLIISEFDNSLPSYIHFVGGYSGCDPIAWLLARCEQQPLVHIPNGLYDMVHNVLHTSSMSAIRVAIHYTGGFSSSLTAVVAAAADGGSAAITCSLIHPCLQACGYIH